MVSKNCLASDRDMTLFKVKMVRKKEVQIHLPGEINTRSSSAVTAWLGININSGRKASATLSNPSGVNRDASIFFFFSAGGLAVVRRLGFCPPGSLAVGACKEIPGS